MKRKTIKVDYETHKYLKQKALDKEISIKQLLKELIKKNYER